MRALRLAPLIEQSCNSLASLLLTVALAGILSAAELGVVTFILIVLAFPIGVLDGLLGAAIVFGRRQGPRTIALRRGALLSGVLIGLLAVAVVAIPTLALFEAGSDRLARLGGGLAVVLAVAAYCLVLGAFEQLRRISYAADLPQPLLLANLWRVGVLALLAIAVRSGLATPGLQGMMALVTATLAGAVAGLGLVLIERRQLAVGFTAVRVQLGYLLRTARHFAANAWTVVAYAALELMLVTFYMLTGDSEAVARYRGLQLAMLVVNLLAVATENANAARAAMAPSAARERYVRTTALLMISGLAITLGFLLLGKWAIGLVLGPHVVPTTFEIACGALLMAAQVIRSPAAILLKFANRFQFMLRLYAAAVVLEAILLGAMLYSGLASYALAAFAACQLLTTLVLVAVAAPLLRDAVRRP